MALLCSFLSKFRCKHHHINSQTAAHNNGWVKREAEGGKGGGQRQAEVERGWQRLAEVGRGWQRLAEVSSRYMDMIEVEQR